MGRKITGIVGAVTGIALVVGTAGAATVTDKKQAAEKTKTNVEKKAVPKVKEGAAPSEPTKSELGSKVDPKVKKGATPGEKSGTALAQKTKTTDPKVKKGATSGEAGAQELIKR